MIYSNIGGGLEGASSLYTLIRYTVGTYNPYYYPAAAAAVI